MASSQFATHSQPTLNAVWKNPSGNLRKAERPPPAEKVAAKPAPVQAPPATVAEDFVMPCSPAVSPPKPGEVGDWIQHPSQSLLALATCLTSNASYQDPTFPSVRL